MKVAAVDHTRNHLAHVKAGFPVGGHDAVELFRVVEGFFGLNAVYGLFGDGRCVGKDVACDRYGVGFVVGRVIAGARHRGVHGGATQCFCGDDFPGGSLDQRRATQKHAAIAAHNDAVVAQRGDVGATGSAVTQHHSNLRHPHFGQRALVAKDTACSMFVGKEV